MPPKPDPPTKRIRVRPNKNKNHLTSDGKPKHRPNPSNKGFKVLGGHQARSGYLGKGEQKHRRFLASVCGNANLLELFGAVVERSAEDER